jgi:hypothetical protein
MLELDDNLARACREFPLDAESMKTTQQWETEHKRWGRKQKHRGEDVIRNPFQSLDFATLRTAYGKMPVDMLHHVPLGLWKHLLSHLKCDKEEGGLCGKYVSRTKNVKQVCRCCIASQCEAISKRKRVPVGNWMRKSRQLDIEKQAMG